MRYPSLLQPPIAFARHAPGAGAPDGALASFRTALERGATGLACEVHLTEDGVAVVHDGPLVRTGLRRRPLSALPVARLPAPVPRLSEIYETCGTGVHLAVTLVDEGAAAVVSGLAREAGGAAEERLWLCSPDWRQAASWRAGAARARLVQVTRLRAVEEGAERRAATLAGAGIDAVMLHEGDWNPGLTTLFHRFERLALAGPTRHRHRLDALVAAGVDGVTSDQVDQLVAAVAASAS